MSFPYVPGFDLSGTVAKLGEGVSDLAVGDEASDGTAGKLEVLTQTKKHGIFCDIVLYT